MDFFVIGAQKSATTWLYKAIGKQPFNQQLPIKELHFWDGLQVGFSRKKRLFHKRLNDRVQSYAFWKTLLKALKLGCFNWFSLKFFYHYLFKTYHVKWYSGFREFSKDKLLGDFTPAYAFLKSETIALMQTNFPNAKVFFILREPIDRVWSQWRMHVRIHVSGDAQAYFDTVKDLTAFKYFFQKEGLNKRCDYKFTIKNYSNYFGEQFYVGYYDDIIVDPQGFLNEICSILSGQLNYESAQSPPSKTNDSIDVGIPKEILEFLKKQLHDQYLWLSKGFDGYPVSWYQMRYGTGSSVQPIRNTSYFWRGSDFPSKV